MRQLRDDTHLILDGEVRVYRRERSKRWQAAFVIDGHTIRISTGKRDLAEAKEYARDTFLEYKFRHKNDLPIVTKKFSDVAKLAIVDMRKPNAPPTPSSPSAPSSTNTSGMPTATSTSTSQADFERLKPQGSQPPVGVS